MLYLTMKSRKLEQYLRGCDDDDGSRTRLLMMGVGWALKFRNRLR